MGIEDFSRHLTTRGQTLEFTTCENHWIFEKLKTQFNGIIMLYKCILYFISKLSNTIYDDPLYLTLIINVLLDSYIKSLQFVAHLDPRDQKKISSFGTMNPLVEYGRLQSSFGNNQDERKATLYSDSKL